MEDNNETVVQEPEVSNSVQTPSENVVKPESSVKKGSGKRWIIIVIVLLLAGGGFLFYRNRLTSKESEESLFSTPTIPVEENLTPTPTEDPEKIDKSKIKIEILNGTGIAGEASFLKTKLTELGYKEVRTGNASEENYTTTEATFLSSLSSEVVDEITQKLNEIYTKVDTKTSKDLKGNDVKVIVGLRKGVTPKPTASPTPKVTGTPTPTATVSATPSITPTKTPTPTP